MTGKTIKVSKLDAARRQLDCAIELWFHDGDAISIHTLVFAAYEIIQDINTKRGNKEATLLGMTQRLVKPEHVEEVMALWKKPMTFFKHANRDPYGVLEFNSETSEYLIVLAMFGLGLLGERPSDMQTVFNFWECLHRPNLIRDGANQVFNSLSVVQIEDMRKFQKSEFLEAALLGLAQARIKR